MTFDPMIITLDMLGLIGDYCGKIQLNSDIVRQSYSIKTKMRLRGVEWVHDLFLFPLVLGKMKLPHTKLGLFCVV